MATAIKGAVIAGERNTTADYYRKCEFCGYTSPTKFNIVGLAHKFQMPEMRQQARR